MAAEASDRQLQAWTIRSVFLQVVRLFRDHWLVLLVATALVPGLWSIPSNILWDALASSRLLEHRSDGPFLAAVVSFVVMAWNLVWEAGGLCIAIAAARLDRIRLRTLLSGVVYAPAAFGTRIVVALPSTVVEMLSLPPDEPSYTTFSLGANVVGTYLFARTIFWLPLMVDARIPFWDAIILTWRGTQGLAMRILGLMFLWGLVLTPIFILEYAFGGTHLYVSFGLANVFLSLGAAVLYVTAWDPYLQDRRSGDAPPATISATSE